MYSSASTQRPVNPVLLAEQLHWRLFRITASIRRQECDPTAGTELTLTQCAVLHLLSDKAWIRMTDLAEYEGVSAPTMSKSVSRLVELGYVRRRRCLSDHRNILVEITDRGAEAQRTAVLHLLNSIITALSPDEIEALGDALAPLERLAAFGYRTPNLLERAQ